MHLQSLQSTKKQEKEKKILPLTTRVSTRFVWLVANCNSMAVFMDLNVLFCADRNRMKSLIETAAHLGFSTVAINYVFEPKAKKQEVPSPMPISELIGKLPMVQGHSCPIRVLNRLTVVMSEASHFRPNASEYRPFDLLAVQPTTEKLFHAACMLCDVDIICILVTERLPFFFKRAPINGSIDRGVVFEVSYASALRDITMRRYTITNAVCLMESCKGKNVILSSAAEKALELRGPYDIVNLGLLFGLSDTDSKEAVTSTCRAVLLHAARKTASGIVYTMKSQQEVLRDTADSEAPAAKRPKST
ncbi:ribonuclease P protein subunit p30 isoform X2 [Fundulus heteroclitus]|uniref:ribonuclease P protein subunit p30 isoform X2 n=1 Tax=Fundulus heteroclitus TaxID=8078 RepID=UPI00165A9B07|nr:ribonuclease P protein subunit p30 isoform X2 [Fundulus heteroclitus]